MITSNKSDHRHQRRIALLAGLPLVLGCVLTVPAEAALVLECNGFTEADAQTLGYVTWRGTAADESFTDVTGAWVWASGGRLSAQADASTYFCS